MCLCFLVRWIHHYLLVCCNKKLHEGPGEGIGYEHPIHLSIEAVKSSNVGLSYKMFTFGTRSSWDTIEKFPFWRSVIKCTISISFQNSWSVHAHVSTNLYNKRFNDFIIRIFSIIGRWFQWRDIRLCFRQLVKNSRKRTHIQDF